MVPEASLRPASSSEIFTKQLLELRPSRKRLREAISDLPDQEHLPFSDDLMLPGWQDEEAQPGFVELSAPSSNPIPIGPGPLPAVAVPTELQPQPDHLQAAPTPFPTAPQDPQHTQPTELPTQPDLLQPDANTTTRGDLTQEPESEMIPETPQIAPTGFTQLQAALHRSPDLLDGIPPPPGLRERSRSPLREPHNVPVPGDEIDEALRAELKQPNNHFHCFMAKRYNKKKKQQGPHTEINFDKADDNRKVLITAARSKEWTNWMKFNAVKIIPPEEVQQFLESHPEAEVLPTRWVDTNKAEVGEAEKLKSRLVVRGDLEMDSSLRTDSPTTSQLLINLIICHAAATGQRLRAGDISAAFLQGAKIDRLLALKLPKHGVPDDQVKPGSLMVALKSVYGTRDAPRGFFKNLYNTLVGAGLKPIPGETAAFYLPGAEGQIEGLLGCHVDDLLWSGGDKMQQIMLEVQKTFKFGLVEDDELKYCGRIISQSPQGLKVTCPNVLDRTKPIYLSKDRRKQAAEPATATEISQLRSIVGSLSWLARVCRPDISFAVNQLQAVQGKASVSHLLDANKVLNYAMQDKQKGLFYPSQAMRLEDAVLLSVNDASHAASFEALPSGDAAGHRSQSGRLLLLAPANFEQTGEGQVYPLEWHSNTIKRVCRSTLQAETMSLQLGSEEAEHMKHVLFYVKNMDVNVPKNDQRQRSMDHMKTLWLSDCRSLTDHLVNPAMSEVKDKRLAIDLTAMRQEVWRAQHQQIGNPTYCDALPPDAPTIIRWISTATMVADGLTKSMRCEQLHQLMRDGRLKVEFQALTPVKKDGCENEH